MTDILMPQLSDSMESGTILSWLKDSGEQIAMGDEILEIETDKSTVTHVAEASGVLEIIAAEGTTVSVGERIAVVLEVGESAPASTAPAAALEPLPAGAGVDSATGDVASIAMAGSPTAAAANGHADRSGDPALQVPATPLARRLAAAHGVSLDGIAGTGPLGRITRADVLAAAGPEVAPSPLPASATRTAGAPAAVTSTPAAAASSEPRGAALASRRREPSRVQQLIARRMSEAKAEIPHFQVQTEVAMDATMALRSELKALAGDGQAAPSLNDFIIKACALALREYPLANGSYVDGAYELHEAINIGVAVAAEDALVVPTIFGVDGKSLGEIARESRRLAARVRSGEVSPAELDGGTFTVSNLGMFGMTAITPVINPPQAAILGVGAIRDLLARVDGEITERSVLTLTLSCDHRILYGADAARFLARVRDLIQTPLSMVL